MSVVNAATVPASRASARDRQRRGVVEHRAEERERPVAVVEHLDQAVLLRPVGGRGGVDLPEAAAVAPRERQHLVLVRVPGDVGDHVRELPGAARPARSPMWTGADTRGSRSQPGLASWPCCVALGRRSRARRRSGRCTATPARRRCSSRAAADGVVAEDDDQLVGVRGRLRARAQPLPLRVVDVAVRRAGDRRRARRVLAVTPAVGDGVDRDEAHAGPRVPRVVAWPPGRRRRPPRGRRTRSRGRRPGCRRRRSSCSRGRRTRARIGEVGARVVGRHRHRDARAQQEVRVRARRRAAALEVVVTALTQPVAIRSNSGWRPRCPGRGRRGCRWPRRSARSGRPGVNVCCARSMRPW